MGTSCDNRIFTWWFFSRPELKVICDKNSLSLSVAKFWFSVFLVNMAFSDLWYNSEPKKWWDKKWLSNYADFQCLEKNFYQKKRKYEFLLQDLLLFRLDIRLFRLVFRLFRLIFRLIRLDFSTFSTNFSTFSTKYALEISTFSTKSTWVEHLKIH